MTAAAADVRAQVPPDAGRILRETRPPEQPPAITVPPIVPPATAPQAVAPQAGEVRVQVTHFIFSGNTALPDDVLNDAVAPWAGRALNFGELIQAVEAVEARYKEAGYFLAQGYLPPQKIRDGAIEIAISEGRLGETRLEGESRVKPDVLYEHLDRLPKDEALRLPILERQILLINELAGGQASLDLQAGEKAGSTDVVLALKADDAIGTRLDFNNHGAPSTGEKRVGLAINASSPFGLGERVSAMALSSENGDLVSYNLRGELPVGGDGWRLTGTASRAEYSLGGAFAALGATGTADSLRLGAAYPLLRSRAANLRIQVEADRSKLVDKFQATGIELGKRSRGFTMTASADMTDDLLGGGFTRADIGLRAGRLELGDTAAALDAPPAGPGTAGRFSKATLQAQRQQTLTREISLQLQLSWQIAGQNLDSSEKLSLGGATSLPGYANGEAAGDSGIHARVGARWQLRPELALTAFTDYARLKLADEPVPGTEKNRKRLTDVGLSADWTPDKRFAASVILAWAGRETPGPADNDKPRLWFSLGYVW